jgi:hypothetical protein
MNWRNISHGSKKDDQNYYIEGSKQYCSNPAYKFNNIACEAGRHSRNKEKKCLKDKINELLQLTVKTRTLETYVEEEVNIRGVTSLEIT